MAAKIQVLVGMIASGKTGYAYKQTSDYSVITVNDDRITELVHGGNYLLYNKEFKIVYKSIEHAIITTGLLMGKTVLIDRGRNIGIRGRARYIQLAKSFDIPIEAIIMPMTTPEIHAQRRFDDDARGHTLEYWTKIANYHFQEYAEPTIKEGFSLITHL